MKERMIGFGALLAIIISYLVFRYPLFYAHGMKDWPLILAVAAIVITGISIIRKNHIVPVFTVSGYIIGFAAGVLLQRDGLDPGGGVTNNLWIIWTTTMLCFVLLGVIVAIIQRRKRILL